MTEPFIHPAGIVENGARIGSRTRIWAFSHILGGALIGEDCNICDHVFIENDVVIGDRVTVKCGVQVWDGVHIENDVFIGPNATFTNDPFPRSRKRPEVFARTLIRCGASVGANATILPGIIIGEGAMVGAGSVITRNVPAHAIAVGNPARIVGYIDTEPPEIAKDTPLTEQTAPVYNSKVRGVSLHDFTRHLDPRGTLCTGSFPKQVPFSPQRFFLVSDVPAPEIRGQNAHRQCHLFLICTHGSLRVVADDASNRESFTLNRPNLGLYLPPLTWAEQFAFSRDAVLLVFASHAYDPADYIRNYADFLAYGSAG